MRPLLVLCNDTSFCSASISLIGEKQGTDVAAVSLAQCQGPLLSILGGDELYVQRYHRTTRQLDQLHNVFANNVKRFVFTSSIHETPQERYFFILLVPQSEILARYSLDILGGGSQKITI